MDDNIKNSIESRKNAILNMYEILDESKINSLFEKIIEFGKECNDAMDFETKFATSPLNSEYISLFTELAQICTMKNQEVPIDYGSSPKELEPSDLDIIKDEVIEELTSDARGEARKEIRSKMFSVPVVGDIMQGMQTASLFNKFKKKKNSFEEEEEIQTD